MILPAGINATWLTSKIIPAGGFEEAQRLHAQDRFRESNEILDGLFRIRATLVAEDNRTGLDALILWGWNLLFLKEHKQLDDLFQDMEGVDLETGPELNVLRLWSLLHRGRFAEVREACRSYVRGHRGPIDPLVADFLFLQAHHKRS